MKESSIFGDRRAERNEWLKHSELYGALSNVIDPSHITGLQRVNGMWRIYTDNLEDKVLLLNEGVSLRGKRVSLLNTNPNRLDSEQTIRIRIKNIPLSVEDGTLTRPLILKNIDVIKSMREKLRYNGKLTNCETGDRLITVKATSLQTPLPRTMMFGKFIGRVIHFGQNSEPKVIKCRKCLEEGHVASDCQNDWKCLTCMKSGHRKGDCDLSNVADDKSDSNEAMSTENQETQRSGNVQKSDAKCEIVKSDRENQKQIKVAKRKSGKQSKQDQKSSADKKQTNLDKFCSGGNQTPKSGKALSAKDRTPPTPEDQLDKKNGMNLTLVKVKTPQMRTNNLLYYHSKQKTTRTEIWTLLTSKRFNIMLEIKCSCTKERVCMHLIVYTNMYLHLAGMSFGVSY